MSESSTFMHVKPRLLGLMAGYPHGLHGWSGPLQHGSIWRINVLVAQNFMSKDFIKGKSSVTSYDLALEVNSVTSVESY